VADALPVAAGVNVTLMEQLAFIAKLVPQVLLCVKSAAFVPLTVIADIAKDAVPVLLSVIVFDGLVVPRV